MKELSYF